MTAPEPTLLAALPTNGYTGFGRIAMAIAIVLAGVIGPLSLLGATRVSWLYSVISYSNSPELDLKVSHFIRHRSEFNLIAIGSSEVRWGISTTDLNDAYNRAVGAPILASFNFGIDGFSPGLGSLFFAETRLLDGGDRPHILLIGINAAEGVTIAQLETSPGACGALQKPVLTSPLGRSAGLAIICEAPEADPLDLQRQLDRIWMFRERSALRDFVTGIRPQTAETNAEPTGFHPYPPAGGAEVRKFLDGLEKMRTEEPERFAPLDPSIWENATGDAGFFKHFTEFARRRGMLPVFFILPTNPVSLRAFDKIETVEENSRKLKKWANDKDVVFIDLGIQRDFSPAVDYADFRHLSGIGAQKYSRRLGAALAAEPKIQAFLATPR